MQKPGVVHAQHCEIARETAFRAAGLLLAGEDAASVLDSARACADWRALVLTPLEEDGASLALPTRALRADACRICAGPVHPGDRVFVPTL